MTPEMYSLIDTALKFSLWPILCIVIAVVYHKQLKSLINKLISAKKLKMNAGPLTFETDENQSISNDDNLDETGNLDTPPSTDIQERKDTHWFLPVESLLEENKVKEAKNVFLEFIRENNNVDYYKEHSFFSYILFEKTQDENVLSELLLEIKQSNNSNAKLEYINSYISCLDLTNQFTKAINFLTSEIAQTNDDKYKVNYIILLSKMYLGNLEIEKAEQTIVELIRELTYKNSDEFDDELYQSYIQLAEIQKRKKNKVDYALCLDKALQFKPSNTDTLFSAAYQASQMPFLESIAISNYSLLNNLSPKHDSVINNLGVAANKLNLKIIACDYYRKAKGLNSSISFSNLGYKLLDAGCAKEAEELASYAITLPNPDKNNYELLAKIKKESEEEQDKWSKYKAKSIEKQKIIRNYIDKKYTSKITFPRDDFWNVNINTNVNVDINGNDIHISWKDNNKEINIYGTIENSVFSGVYSSKPITAGTLLGGSNTSISAHCIGIYDELKDQILIVSTDVEKDVNHVLTKRMDV
ncbi:hypothetical protein [Escherichia coli]|uniref:hypothetical protein n=2 Tax=Enterobacteriaceae TaxID=543 RepID=UPI000DA48110|nr:hypothetical protein [Escherichia coli]EFJ2364042.1 hypothetical protein [Escherichia coli]MBW9346565.1 hypothetical protein [Escherichia coli]QMD67543.1 hypothetical protein HVZ36_15695 [Escherichia coli]SQZ87963.1 Uncharacterised protein [Escherichia coli]